MRTKKTLTTIVELLLFSIATVCSSDIEMSSPLRLSIQCNCGKFKAAISPKDPLRLVCYCKDCRGYYNTLNGMAGSASEKPAKLDEWGGVDWTFVYPRDITIMEGEDLLKTCLIRSSSKMRQVYCGNCLTPIFRFGEVSVLMNSNLVREGELPGVRYRIIGRQATAGATTNKKKPSMSWSVPLSWFWVMSRRVNKEYMSPMPLELPDLKDIPVLENFKEG
jgi:hypothetical protein